MKYAFLHKNFRNLSFERKVIFLSHSSTLFLCFFPWFSATSFHSGDIFYSGFEGPSFLIGSFVFLISLVIFAYFVDKLFEKQKIKLPFSENWLFSVAGIQQLLLLSLACSVLVFWGKDFDDYEIRFGFFLIIIAQVSGLVATFLNHQLDQEKKVKSFFKHPNEEKENKKTEENLFSPKK